MSLDELRALATVKDGPHLRFQPPYQQMSVTLDEAEFLYALVRALKPPICVLELGTGLGLSGRFIAEALLADGDAMLMTIEPSVDCRWEANSLLSAMPALIEEECRANPDTPDLVYIDSGEKHRWYDIKTWLTNGYAGVVIVHDAERDYPEIAEHGNGVYLPTANGMWLGRAK